MESKQKKPNLACTFCRKRKRKCDGQKPCAMCVKYNKAGDCDYPLDKDRRKWKFDSTHVDYLELRADLLEQLADELTRLDPIKAQRIGLEQPKLKHVRRTHNPMSEQLVRNLADEDAIDELVSTRWRVRQRQGQTEFYGPVSGRQQVFENAEEEQFIAPNHRVELVSSSHEFRLELIESFKKAFSQYFLVSWQTLEEVKQWEYPSPDVSKQLLMCAIFAYGAVFSTHNELAFAFLRDAEQMALKASRNNNNYVLQALLIMSCFHLGMGLHANSWTFCTMSTSMTQYMGLHKVDESYKDGDTDSLVARRAPSSAMFWSIILQDRIITSVLGRGCRIQHFRVKTDFYTPSRDTVGLEEYTTEWSFAVHTQLWFIYDKFISQIYSNKAELLHDSHRITLIQQGVEAVHQLQISLPEDFKLSPGTDDSRILILHLSFSVVNLLLHKAYLNQMPLKVIHTMVKQCQLAGEIVSTVTRVFQQEQSVPYFASYLVLSVATFDLFLATNKDVSISSSAISRLELHADAFLAIGQYWRRGLKDLQVMGALAKRWNVQVPVSDHALQRETENLDELILDLDNDYFFNQFSFDS